jgi:hypothetical protein
VGFLDEDFGVDAAVDLGCALVAGVDLCEPFGSFLEFPLDS